MVLHIFYGVHCECLICCMMGWYARLRYLAICDASQHHLLTSRGLSRGQVTTTVVGHGG